MVSLGVGWYARDVPSRFFFKESPVTLLPKVLVAEHSPQPL